MAAAILRLGDRIVELCDLLGIGVDIGNRTGNFVVDTCPHAAQLCVHALEPRNQGFGTGQHGLARRRTARIIHQVLDALEETLDHRCQAHGRIGQHIVDLIHLGVIGIELAGAGLRGDHLRGEEVIKNAFDAVYIGAVTDVATAGQVLSTQRGLDHQLTAITRRLFIGNIVSGRRDTCLRCGES
ncbi:hypothetical protein D3C81_1482390 [compost metagenome]